jgi:hypothetical protein
LVAHQSDTLPLDKNELAHFLHARHREIGFQVIRDAIETEQAELRALA